MGVIRNRNREVRLCLSENLAIWRKFAKRFFFFGLAFVRSILDLYRKIVSRIDIPVAARSKEWV